MIKQALPSDHGDILRFETSVFRVPFRLIMPKLYSNAEKCAVNHRIMKKDGKIIGAYAAYKTKLTTAGGELSAVGIGSVAVSKSHRNEGIMSQMMQDAEDEARESMTDLGFLSGYRKRYERFGYIPGGEKFIYDITSHYIKHNAAKNSFSFTELKKRKDMLCDAVALFESQPVHWQRNKDDFCDIVSTWYSRCYVVTDKDDRFSGFLITDFFHKEVSEILLCDEASLSDVIVSFANRFSKKQFTVTLYPQQVGLNNILATFGEHFRVQASAMIKFFGFQKPIELMMNEKLRSQKLCEGVLVLDLSGEKLEVQVKDGVCTVTPSDEKADVTLGYADAVKALTTHFGNVESPLFKAWSPMCPIAVPHVDMV